MTATAIQSIDWDAFSSELSGIEIISDRAQVVKLSQDYYHFSPVLQPLLSDKTGDLVVRPRQRSRSFADCSSLRQIQNSANC